MSTACPAILTVHGDDLALALTIGRDVKEIPLKGAADMLAGTGVADGDLVLARITTHPAAPNQVTIEPFIKELWGK